LVGEKVHLGLETRMALTRVLEKTRNDRQVGVKPEARPKSKMLSETYSSF
jgi:hypothetical protein